MARNIYMESMVGNNVIKRAYRFSCDKRDTVQGNVYGPLFKRKYINKILRDGYGLTTGHHPPKWSSYFSFSSPLFYV
jgi:hypothetical protein